MSVLLQVSNLKKQFPVTGGLLRRHRASLKAVDGVSFSIKPGETYGLVGESGCGKTTTAKMVLLLEEPTDGGIQYEDLDALNLDREGARRYKVVGSGRVPGPVGLAESAHAGERNHRRTAANPTPR